MKIYLAAPFKLRQDMRILRSQLMVRGHTVTSSWLDVDLDDDDYRGAWMREAMRDFGDIRNSDLVALRYVAEPQRGGCLIEYGYALGQGIPCVVFGSTPDSQFFELGLYVGNDHDLIDFLGNEHKVMGG